jgi:hypothetical protein
MANIQANHNEISEVSNNFRDNLIPLDHRRLRRNDRNARTQLRPGKDDTPFYCSVHSPVGMDESDHRSGVWRQVCY